MLFSVNITSLNKKNGLTSSFLLSYEIEFVLFLESSSSNDSISENDVSLIPSPVTDETSELTEIINEPKEIQSYINAYPLCKECGLKHKVSENHEYDYSQV